MWKIINSPIVIATLVVASLIAYDHFRKNTTASEIRGVYEEVLSISEDAKTDLEKKKIIESFVRESVKQVRD